MKNDRVNRPDIEGMTQFLESEDSQPGSDWIRTDWCDLVEYVEYLETLIVNNNVVMNLINNEGFIINSQRQQRMIADATGDDE